jgi:regulator of protease activity HflC (stomatin/prohibitin superfamily)
MQVVTMPVPAQEGITRDNVSVSVDAVLYYRVEDPIVATVHVQNYSFAILQVAQTSLRSIIGKSELDDLLSGRESLHEGLELMLASPALGWGIHIDRVEIKNVVLPESMKRSMAVRPRLTGSAGPASSPRTESCRRRGHSRAPRTRWRRRRVLSS